jgi:hypothetical protein
MPTTGIIHHEHPPGETQMITQDKPLADIRGLMHFDFYPPPSQPYDPVFVQAYVENGRGKIVATTYEEEPDFYFSGLRAGGGNYWWDANLNHAPEIGNTFEIRDLSRFD